ncbi:Hypp9063 [Branchiostoma lanceolatum]|nr:Hypp9063 [Branchiostoma lanceolatum]
MFEVRLSTTVTFTCTSTGWRPPATLTWAVTESGAPVSVNPTYTSSNNSQGVGDATSTFILTTANYGVPYSAQCTASGPDPVQTRTSAIISFTTEPEPIVSSTIAPSGPTGDVDANRQ